MATGSSTERHACLRSGSLQTTMGGCHAAGKWGLERYMPDLSQPSGSMHSLTVSYPATRSGIIDRASKRSNDTFIQPS